MISEIGEYRIERQIETYYASSLLQAKHSVTDKPAIIKTLSATFPDLHDIKRLEREYWVLRQFDDVGGVVPVSELVLHGNGNPAIVSDVAGLPLTHFIKSGAVHDWSLERVVTLIIQIAEAIDAVHAHSIVHKNIAPQNILLSADTWTLNLMNFEIATSLSSEHQDRNLSKRLEGSLPYISPEQTGRMSYGLDHRSDFYSLGVVVYELLFGCLPHNAQTQLEWVHAHIGKLPIFPEDARQRFPDALIDITLRLLAKSPDLRYQSCFGLLHDLKECQRQFSRTGRIEPFTLAQNDVSEVFVSPQVLYGRDAPLAKLTDLFERVTHGASEISMISGYSGVGKTTLVAELNKPAVSARGYYLSGKFDQFERAKPYAGISAAFSGLVQELLTETSEHLAAWKDEMLQVLSGNAQVLIDVIPGLETIFGKQPPAAALPPTQAQNRLQITFINFMRRLASGNRPVILYLDDLQWSDAPTLNLLQKLATARDIGGLLIIGSYRSNEVDGNHMLTLMRNEVAKSCEIHDVELAPLDQHAVNQIIAGALRADLNATSELSNVLFRQSEGNPFFVNELLKSLIDEKAIQFDRSKGQWTWDIASITRAEVGEGVVDFLIGNLNKLPEDTKDALRFAACIGHEFDLEMLSVVHQVSKRDLGLALMSALLRNIILPLDDDYQLFDKAASNAETLVDPSLNPRFRFQHDRLHQAAYELIEDADKQRVHLEVGRLLQQEAGDLSVDKNALKIVGHLNEARSLINDEEEKEDLAKLNLAAASIAHDASSYQAGLHYLRTARTLLPKDSWKAHYELSKAISSLFSQTAYLNKLHEEADTELSLALENVRSPLEKAQVLSMRTRHYSTSGRMDDSIESALQGLRLLGIDIGNDIPDSVLTSEIDAIAPNLGGRDVADLIHAPRMSDPNISAAVGLLMEIFPAAFLSGAGKLFHLLVIKSVNLSLKYGNSTETAFAFAAYGMLLSGKLNKPAEGNAYGKLALAMNESFDDIGLKSRIIYVYTMFNHHWNFHWSSMTELFKQGIESGYQSGDLLYLAYNAQDCVIWDPTLELDTAIAEQTKYLEIVKDCNYADSFDSATLFLQMLLNFTGRTDGQFSLSDTEFDEAVCLDGMQSRRFITGVANYNIYKAEIHCIYRDFYGALPFIEAQEELIDSVMSLPQLVRFRFLAFLTYASVLHDAGQDQKTHMHERMNDHLRQMKVWSDNCPENFLHLELAMRAETARLKRDSITAFQTYERAAESAAQNGFIRDRAMIHELNAFAYREQKLNKAADGHLRAARYFYQRWGASRKTAQLDADHPNLSEVAQTEAAGSMSKLAMLDHDGGITQESLDLASVMAASRAISGEIVLRKLLTRTMGILLETTGAQRAVFVSEEGDVLRVEVECFAEQHAHQDVTEARDIKPDIVPLSVINYVLRTRKPLVLDDAAASGKFNNDPYIAGRQTRSVICAPIVRADTFEGIVYLENDLAAGAFPEARVAIVELLAAQASISIEHAKLYDELEHKVEERTAKLSQKTTALEAVANQLSKYLSPQVYRSIFDHQKEVRLTSERKRLTIFFSDLVGFTEIADLMESEELTGLLNQYLSEMSEIALSFGATIDKFVGDGIVIFFGDPETQGPQKDALACAKMAVSMRERLAVLRRQWADQGIDEPFRARMGLHTGYCTVGNFGSDSRMDYTMIGGAVNLASRLEGAAAPGTILISKETFAQIKDEVFCTKREQINVRGITRAVQTYEVVDLLENLSDSMRPIRDNGPHMQLNVDATQMSAKERQAVAKRLRAAAEQLESTADQNQLSIIRRPDV